MMSIRESNHKEGPSEKSAIIMLEGNAGVVLFPPLNNIDTEGNLHAGRWTTGPCYTNTNQNKNALNTPEANGRSGKPNKTDVSSTLNWGAEGEALILEPRRNDVLGGRGKTAFLHPGNKLFRQDLLQSLDEFKAPVRKPMRYFIDSIIQKVIDRGGRFLKRADPSMRYKKNCRYAGGYRLESYQDSREKVKNALRDCRSNKVKWANRDHNPGHKKDGDNAQILSTSKSKSLNNMDTINANGTPRDHTHLSSTIDLGTDEVAEEEMLPLFAHFGRDSNLSDWIHAGDDGDDSSLDSACLDEFTDIPISELNLL